MTAPRGWVTAWACLMVSFLAACPSRGVAQPPAAPAAQPGPRPAAPVTDPEAAPVVVERDPPIIYLPDEKGDLQPVINFPLAEFQQLLTLRDLAAGNLVRPSYALVLSLTGRQVEQHAELDVAAEIKLARDGWVRVPLRLDGAALAERPDYEGPGTQIVEFDADGDGYVVWLRGRADEVHRLQLKLLVPLAVVGDETRLKLALPLTEPARFDFLAAIPEAQAKVTAPAVVESRQADPLGTRFGIVGLAGEFELSWRERPVSRPDEPTALEVASTIQLSLDGRTVTSEATLLISSLAGGEFATFDIRLPPGAELITPPRQNYSLVDDAPTGEGTSSAAHVVRIALEEPTSQPVEVRLVTQCPYTPAANQPPVELAGFEVLGAVRQTGHLAVQVVGDWQVIWGDRRGFRQVDELPPALRSEDVLAGFEILSQPASLLARVVPRETRLSVEPDYLVLVDDEQVRLEARLRYTIRGAKSFALEVDLPDWTIDEVGPAALLDLNGLVPEEKSPLALPFLQPTIGEVQVVVRAHRPLPAGTQHLRLNLPRPRADALGPAAVVVLPADNVTLVPRADQMQGLDRQAASTMNLPARQQEPLVFRGAGTALTFAADFRIEPGTVAVALAGQVDVREDGLTLEETLTYEIRHEPVESLLLLAPRSVIEAAGLELFVNDQPVKPIALGNDGSTPPGIERVRLALSTATIGACVVRVRLPIASEPVPVGATVNRTCPLVMPGEAELTRCELRIEARPGVQVQVPTADWSVLPGAAARRRELIVAAGGPRFDLPLAVNLADRAPFGGTYIERAWVQSWWAGATPQQRVAWSLVSGESELTIALPDDVAPGTCEVRVDGRRVAPTLTPEGRLQISLAPANDDQHRVEFDYRLAPRAAQQAPQLSTPALVPDAWVRQLYWELVLSPGKHLWSAPKELLSENRWTWGDLGWSRQPSYSTSELESWIGVERRTPPPAGATRYLLGASGAVPAVEVALVERRSIVLMAAGAALGLGLILIYWSAARHPAALLTLGALLSAWAAYAPEPALLVAQAAVGGLLLALVAWMLRRWTLRRHQPVVVPRSRGSSIIELGSTARQRAAAPAMPSTTEPAPSPLAVPIGEPQP